MQVQEVKNIVSTARDLLVGKVPLPVDQCQEITRALIYKFLSAEDATSVALGGAPRYFTGEHAECRWDTLMSPEQTANEVDRRYRDGMAMLDRADVMPAIRTIYQDAYIPYNDPIILRDFLRAIDRFDTDDTEKIGDAYEMLLQDLGAQASAGQFRTPRHIIDFIVAVIDPQKHETILDPACGTGGFLASTWEHVNRASRLSAADRGNLARNLAGYDISPTMAMLSTVNLFLHHQQQPVVSVYDTLTSEERWNDHYDVILANPPFMSPKGGIRPHGRFFSNSRRSEVLFVDYIMGHLNEGGRAGVIVPEGVIFQSQRAHTQLRRLLVETALAAVVSLPAGVFQPYSGVKTSILILDKTLSRRADGIAFFKVENDGYDLGAQRRPIDRNDLPTVQAELYEYFRRLRASESVDDFTPQTGLVVAKERIADGGDYNLSGERYRANSPNLSNWPMVSLGNCVDILDRLRRPITKSDRTPGPYPYFGATGILDYVDDYIFDEALVLVGEDGAKWGAGEQSAYAIIGKTWVNNHAHVLRPKRDMLLDGYLIAVLNHADLTGSVTGITVPKLNQQRLRELQIPLPPLEVQREIVAEIEGYQRVIDGARAVVDNWRPLIAVDPEWPLVELGNISQRIVTGPFGSSLHQSDYVDDGIPVINPQNIIDGTISKDNIKMVSEDTRDRLTNFTVQDNDIIIGRRGEIGRCGVVTSEMNGWLCGTGSFVIRPKGNCLASFLFLQISSPMVKRRLEDQAVGVTMKNLNQGILSSVQIPLPPLETQQAIVAEIEAEQALVSANRELAQRMEERIAAAIGRVWAE